MISYKQGLISFIASQAWSVSSSLAVCTQSQATPSFPLEMPCCAWLLCFKYGPGGLVC